ncbi:hypothetical protein ACFL1M_03300 [Patescibacteria group bacterium]
MAIGDDWTIDYTNQMVYHSSGTTVYEMWELYSWLMDEIDESGTIDDTVPMTAQTPTAYTLTNSWYINENYYSSFEYLQGGAVKTEAWDAGTYNAGIRVFTFQSGGYVNAVVGDIGAEVGYSGGTPADTGTLLDFDNTNRIWWVRVDDTGDTFANTATALDITDGAGTGAGTLSTASTTGEALWTNIYTLGTIASDTLMYIYQNNSQITSWWSDGHIDVLAKVKQAGTLIDYGVLTVYARKYSTLFENFTVDASGGGRIPIPMGTANDLNNNSGFKSITTTAVGTDDFTVGDEISGDTSNARAIITEISGSDPTYTFSYYLIGDLTDFQTAAEGITNEDATGAATKDGNIPSDVGPNTGTPATITVTFGSTTQDLSNGNGSRPYSVIVDCQQVALSTVYERLKYLTRRGATGDIDDGTQTVVGEQYEATGDYYIPYDTLAGGTFTPGNTLTSTDQSTFSGTITSDYDRASSDGFLIVRNVSGTVPIDGENLTDGSVTASVDTATESDPVEVVAQTNDSPFGTFAGGKLFGARGVWITDYQTSDATNFELIDSEGVLQTPPNNVPITVTGVAQNTQCYVADSVPTTYLNTAATTLVGGDEYQATTTLTYSSDISVTVRAREMGYLPFETSGTISDSGISVTAVWLQDPNFKFTVTGENIQFTNATSLITRTGNFTTDGWLAIMSQITVEGSANNDGTYELSAVGTTTVTITGASLTDEGPVAGVTLTFTRRAPTW